MFENLTIGHLLIALVIILLLFGAKRIPEIAGSLGQGINVFKKSMSSDDKTPVAPAPIASRDSVPLSAPNPASGTAVTASDDVVREPKRLL